MAGAAEPEHGAARASLGDGSESDVPARRRRRLSPGSLFVIRILLVADGLILAVVGGISAAFVARPAGLAFAAGAWVVVGLLFACLPLTDPYRHERPRVSRRSPRGNPRCG